MLLVLIIAVLAFHVVVAYGMMTRRFNALYVVAAMYMFMSPVSTATQLPDVFLIKQGRVYCTVMLVILAILAFRAFRFGTASVLFATFIAYYWIGAMWSDEPVRGLLYKGLFGAVFLSGILLATSTIDIRELKVGMRILSLAGAAFATFVLLELVRNPSTIAHIGRLMAFGMNPNFIGQSAASMFIVSAFLALYDRGVWRTIGYAVGGTLWLIILYTGSRGSAGMALAGGLVLVLPLVKRPGTLLASVVVGGVILYFGLGLVEEHARSRFGAIHLQSREGVWGLAMEYFRAHPLLGNGWVYGEGLRGPATSNMHSIYMQILVELGIVGVVVLFSTLTIIGMKALATWRCCLEYIEDKHFSYLMIALLCAVFAHGVVESSTFMGTSVNAILLGFAVGLIDRLPQLVRLRAEEEQWLEEPELSSPEAYALPAC